MTNPRMNPNELSDDQLEKVAGGDQFWPDSIPCPCAEMCCAKAASRELSIPRK